MTSPAQRFDTARKASEFPLTRVFAESAAFELDEFQFEACYELEAGRSVLVAAPTGAGKTIVGEFAIHMAMTTDTKKAFYTAPIKALSNQKFRELVDRYGQKNVGLLTGDTSINPGARIVVMTTEVLRNMLYADSDALRDLAYVVMDEVHYLADRFRGAVWEEIIIHLPDTVSLVALSATVSNAEEFGDWLDTVRGDTAVVVSEIRPVPLEQHVLAHGELLPLFEDGPGAQRVNRDIERLRAIPTSARNERGRGGRGDRSRHGRHGSGRGRSENRPPRGGDRMDRPRVIETLERSSLLPAIVFIFSRAGCEGAVTQCRRAGIRLTTKEQQTEIRNFVRERTAQLAEEDLHALGYFDWLANLERGFAAHHAGLLPIFKEIVEELFQRRLVTAVFATETLALGINMPARTVVLEKLEKFNGEARVPITAGEYTQLTGRAGRRGIDVEGHSVVHWTGSLDPQAVASLASRRTYPLNSSFKPTYNMAVNLLSQFSREHTRDVLESSFAQFQADRAVVGLAREVRAAEESLKGYEASMTCDKGNFREYSRLRRELSDLEKQNRADSNQRPETRKRRQKQISKLRAALTTHPCHNCPDREAHARWAERYWKLRRETDKKRKLIDARTGSVARRFDRIVDVLEQLGYVVDGGEHEVTLTEHGKVLRRIYGERDLLVAESLRAGIWDSLSAPEFAALASCIVYEARREDGRDRPAGLPKGVFRERLDQLGTLWAELDDIEQTNDLPGSEPPSAALAPAIYSWARGAMLETVLIDTDLAAGDFVRWVKQTIDLLDQLSLVAPAENAATARAALDAIRRGIVAYSGL